MKTVSFFRSMAFTMAILAVLAVLAGCGGDDISFAPEAGTDGGADATRPRDGTVSDSPTSDITPDVGQDTKPETEAGPVPQRVLVTSQNTSSSELVAIDVATGKIDGNLVYPGFGTTDAHSSLFPFVLEQQNNVVGRLDAHRPWVIDSSWSVLLHDGVDGGFLYTDPYAAVIGAGDKTYVLRYNRNQIAVINALQTVDAGPPLSTIDLSSLVQAGGDGAVEMTAGVYVAASNMLYVVLGNLDQNTFTDGDLLCTGTTSTVVGIDTTTDKIKSLGGTGPGGAIALKGFNPAFNGVVYDSATAGGRILIFEAGCNLPGATADAGPGAITKRGVEAVNLSDGSTTVLLDTAASPEFASGGGYPDGFVYIDATHAILGFDFTGFEVYNWDPTSTTLGKLIPNAPDAFVSDGAGNLLGTLTTFGDGGSSSTSVVKVDIATGKSTTLNASPFTTPGGFVGGVDLWPHL
jgi:hypothetical protein